MPRLHTRSYGGNAPILPRINLNHLLEDLTNVMDNTNGRAQCPSELGLVDPFKATPLRQFLALVEYVDEAHNVVTNSSWDSGVFFHGASV